MVDSVVQRQQVKSFSIPDDDMVSNELRELWEYNNMESQQVLLHTETRVQGHGFVCVGANPKDRRHPLITVESSRNMIARIDPRTRTVESALRVYFDPWENGTPDYATLYTPEYTLWLEKQHGKWVMTGRDDHHLGVVPVVQFLNRPRAGDFLGESEMADVVRPTDMAARAILDLQIAMETHAVPGKWAIGVTHNDFIDAKTGQPASAIKTYFNSMLTSKNANAKFGQFTASDLSNFKTVIDLLSEQMSAITGLPMRYFGMNTANPAAEGAIRADELRLVKNVELKNAVDAMRGRRSWPWRTSSPPATTLTRTWCAATGRIRTRLPTLSVLMRSRSSWRPASFPARGHGTSLAGARPARTRSASTSPSRSANPMANS